MNRTINGLARLSVAALSLGLLACQNAESTAPLGTDVYDVPVLSTEELREHFSFACKVSQRTGRPILADFGAPWCGDCRQLARMEREPELTAELAHFQQVRVNLGEDLHEDLRQALKVRAIARWLVFQPNDCQLPITRWPLLASRVVEPRSHAEGASVEALAKWLRDVRSSSNR